MNLRVLRGLRIWGMQGAGRELLFLSVAISALCTSCSPRDYLTRRLAADLISASDTFKSEQHFVLRTGVISNAEYASPEYLVLQHRTWISATNANCSPGLAPAPCWDVILTPSGVDTIHAIVSTEDATKPSITIPVARRELVAVTGISKQGNAADVEFTWKWNPLNEIGAALYSGDLHYKATVGLRQYDDGWRILDPTARPNQTMDDSLKNAEPTS